MSAGTEDQVLARDASAEDALRRRVLAVKALIDNLVQGLRQIGAALEDAPSQKVLGLVEVEAERARAALAAIIADLQPPPSAAMLLDGSLQQLMLMAGPELARDLVDRLQDDLASVAAALRAAWPAGDWPVGNWPVGDWPAGDWPVLRSQSHILVSLAGAAGARRLQAGAEHLNNAANLADGAAMHLALPPCLTQITALRQKIRTLPLPEAADDGK